MRVNEFDNYKYIADHEIEVIENKTPIFFKEGETGTKIVISHLNEPLEKRQIRNLHRNIQSIKSPFENEKFKLDNKAATFDVILKVPDKADWIEDLHEMQDIVDQALFKFMFLFNEGKWSWHYEFNPNEALKSKTKISAKQLSEDSQNLEILDRGVQATYAKNPETFLNDIGPVVGELYVFDFDSAVREFYPQTKTVKSFLSENKGVRLYRDGIRVYNYGEPSDDWLEMDQRRVNRLSKGLNRGITTGAISLNLLPTQDLLEKTNREGFIENDSFKKLRVLVQSALSKFEDLREIDKDKLRSLTSSEKSSIKDIDNPIQKLKKTVSKKGWDDELLPLINRVESSYKEMQDIMLTAGMAGLNMATAFHEIHRGIKDTRKIVEAEKDKTIIIKQFERFELLLDTYADLLKKEKVREFTLRELLKANMDIADVRFTMHDIIHSCPVLTGEQEDYRIKMQFHLMVSSVNNLIDNSIYWLDQRWGIESNKKYLYIGVSDAFEKGPAIIIADNGPGFRNISREEMVKPFLTTKVGGMGIGLYFAKTAMEMMGGELLILDAEDVDIPEKVDGAVVALIFNGGVSCKS